MHYSMSSCNHFFFLKIKIFFLLFDPHMNSLSLNKVQYTIIIFFYKSHEDWKCKKKKKELLKNAFLNFLTPMIFFNCIIYLQWVFFLNSLKIIFVEAIFVGLLTKNMQYIDTWFKKMYNLINNHFVCIFPGQYYTFIHDCIYNGEGNMNPEGNMIVLEVIIFISPEHSCNKLFLYRNSSNANMY